jgi:hypothetical protein
MSQGTKPLLAPPKQRHGQAGPSQLHANNVPKTVVIDKVLFKFPKDKEFQFPAAVVMQNYVNGYNFKMAHNDTSFGKATWELSYGIDIAKEDWELFQTIGLKLATQPVEIKEPDMLVDLSEERLVSFGLSHKHCTQLYGLLCGVGTLPIPDVSERLIGDKNGPWAVLNDDLRFEQDWELVTADDLLNNKNKWKGVIGYQSWQTYMAATMGCTFQNRLDKPQLAIGTFTVIEVLQKGHPQALLSKWINPKWHLVIEEAGNVERQIRQVINRYDLTKEI